MLLLIGIFVFLAACGFAITRYALLIRDLSLLIPVSLGIGSVLHFFLLNILLRFIPVLPATWLVLALMALMAALSWQQGRRSVRPLMLDYSRSMALVLGFLWIGSVLALYQVRRSYGDVDEVDHGARASLIGQWGLQNTLGFALRSYSSPEICDQYHYAQDAMAGVLARQTKLDWREVANLRVAYHAAAILGLCFAFLRPFVKHPIWAILGCLLLLTIGPASWLALLHRVDFLDDLARDSAVFERTQAYASLVSINPTDPFAFIHHPPNLMVSFTSYLSSGNPWGFWTICLLIWVLWFHWEAPKKRHYFILGILCAFSALHFTSGLILSLGPVGLYLLWNALQKREWQNLLIFCATGLVALLIQGGLITSVVSCRFSSENYIKSLPFYEVIQDTVYYPSASANSSPLRLFSYLEPNSPSENVAMLNPKNWLSVLVDWGFGLPLFGVVSVYIFRRQKNPRLNAILAASGLSLIIPFSTTLFLAPNDMYRLAILPVWIGGMLSVLIWQDFSGRWRLLLPFILGALCLTGLHNFATALQRPPSYAYFISELDFQVQAEWQGRLDPFEERVWDPWYHPLYEHTAGASRAIQVFATYSSRHTLPGINAMQDPATQAWMFSGLPGDFKISGYDYLYVDQAWLNNPIGFMRPLYLEDPSQYELVQSWQFQGQERRLYRAVGESSSISPDILAQEATIGLSADHFQEFLDYRPTFWENEPQAIFNPAQGELRYNPAMVAIVAGNLFEQGRFEKEAAFDLIAATLSSRYENQLSLDETSLAEWKNTRQASALRSQGIHYLLVDAFWLSWNTEEEYNRLMASDEYTLLRSWKMTVWGLEMDYYYLFRING